MRLDRVQVAIRPRGLLECLDLAVLVSGRRPLGLLVAAAVGALPMILLNRAVFHAAQGQEDLLMLGLFTALEMPWAAAPLTLYLGQVMFAERFSVASCWHCLRSAATALLPMLLYETIGRGFAFVTCIGAPVWLAVAFFMGPVILLERGRWTTVSGRSIALCKSEMERIPLLLLIDALLLVVGWALGVAFIEEFAAVWQAGTLSEVFEVAVDPFAEDGDMALAAVQAFVSWPSQIAFWLAAAALTIVRFFTYLDARIRHEGWDVELKFRSPRTYAGLATPARAAAGLVVVAGLLGGPAGAGHAAAADAVTGSTTDAADTQAGAADGNQAGNAAAGRTDAAAAGAAVRAALVKQRARWYDAARDGFRPLVSVAPPPSTAPPMKVAIPMWMMITLLVLPVAGVIWLIVRFGLEGRSMREDGPAAAEMLLGAEALEALPAAARRHDGDLLAEAARLASAGDHAAAMVFFHGWQLVQLHGRGVIELARGKTTRRYATEVAAAAPALAPLFRRSNRLFEDALFGRLPIAAADFAAVWEQRNEFLVAAGAEAAA